MGILGIIIGAIGVAVSIVFGIRSKRITDAFSSYVELEQEVKHLQGSTKGHTQKVRELEELKADIYRNKYKPKSKTFTIGDKVKLIKIPQSRGWITEHSKIGMTGVVVDYGPGVYEYTVYWSQVDYEGKAMDEAQNRWQTLYVTQDQIERIG